MRGRVLKNLLEMRVGESGFIERIEGGSGLVNRLERIGIRPGVCVRKVSDVGPVVVEIANTKVAIGRGMASKVIVEVKMFRVLLFGNPNVGKSVIFSRLTGLFAISSNYPGTTVDYTKGDLVVNNNRIEIVDVPGSYTLEATCTAEEVARDFCEKGEYDLIVNVLDATNIERNLYLTLQLLEKRKPMVVLLNKWDIAKRRGIKINVEELSRRLGVPVIPVIAVTGEGLKELISVILSAIRGEISPPEFQPIDHQERWHIIGHLSQEVQTISHKHPSLWEKFEEASLHPFWGTIVAVFVLGVTFILIRYVGEGLINLVFDPFFQKVYAPGISSISGIISSEFIKNILFGKSLEFMSGFGVLTTGVYIPIAVVLPYIFAFYLVLGILEDVGYLPRLAVLMDRVMHRIGLHGYALMPVILGCGCKVPGILALRVLESRRERLLALALLMVTAPCMPQSAMIISLISPFGTGYVVLVFGILVAVAVVNSLILTKLLKWRTPELIIEVPSYQIPHWGTLLKKLLFRVRVFFVEAVPMIMLGVFLIGVLDAIGVLGFIERLFGSFVTDVLGLPPESAIAMFLGFLRKDTSIALLTPLNLDVKQAVIGSVFLVLYLPCVASFFVILKEMGWKSTLMLILLTLFWAISVCFLINLLW